MCVNKAGPSAQSSDTLGTWKIIFIYVLIIPNGILNWKNLDKSTKKIKEMNYRDINSSTKIVQGKISEDPSLNFLVNNS